MSSKKQDKLPPNYHLQPYQRILWRLLQAMKYSDHGVMRQQRIDRYSKSWVNRLIKKKTEDGNGQSQKENPWGTDR